MITAAFPNIRVAVRNDTHAKVLLIEPCTVYISSANFGDSGWVESTIGLHSTDAYTWYVENIFTPVWSSAVEIGG